MEPELIIKIVKDYFKVTEEELRCKSRDAEYVQPRQIIFFFCKEYTNLSLTKIACLCNRKTHADALHGIKTVKNQIDTDRKYRKIINEIRREIRLSDESPEMFMHNDYFPMKEFTEPIPLGKPFRNPYMNHSVCTNQPYMGYKTTR